LHADYLSPVQISIDTALEALGMETEEVSTSTTDILKRYKKGLRNAVQLEHAQWDNDDIHSIYSNPAHNRYSQDFHQRTVDEKRKEPLRVLDLFSGVGSATIVLKKLKIPLCTVVHVEHDPVAVEVCKFHHDNDGIRHVYVEAFEEIYGSGKDPDEDIVTRFIEDYGPFDLVLASPPYQNISPANGRKASKESVQYVARVGLLIQKMNDIQRQKHHVTHDILFLSESILLRKDMESSNDTLEAINQSYGAMDGSGVAPIHLDAKDFSPCKRRSFYWCNVSK
jgi:SAM-dependent methyltransferase